MSLHLFFWDNEADRDVISALRSDEAQTAPLENQISPNPSSGDIEEQINTRLTLFIKF